MSRTIDRGEQVLAAAALLASVASAQTPTFPPAEALEGKGAGELVTRLGTYHDSPADWGILLVPENRSDPDARVLRLAIARQHAIDEPSEPPIFNLVGGPGNSNVWGSGQVPVELRRHSEVVRVGYRGIDSQDDLDCVEFTRALLVERPLAQENVLAARRVLRARFDELIAAGIDVHGYNLAEVVADLEATRAALGYERIDLLAVSWGAQIAHTYAMRHPERVRRMLLVGAGGRGRGFDLWNQDVIDAKLARYAELWAADAEASARCPDILAAMRSTLASLPRVWRGITIDPDKVRLSAWSMLGETGTAGQLLDAFAAAHAGDPAGLALLSWGYDDELRREVEDPHGNHHGEFFSKVMSSGMSQERDYLAETTTEDGRLGSPLARLLWGAASHGGWPIRSIPPDYLRDDPCAVETLVLMGGLDLATPHEYVEAELMPTLENGELVVLARMGHTAPAHAQPEAFSHLTRRFFREGRVDASRYTPAKIDFTPDERLADLARALIPERD